PGAPVAAAASGIVAFAGPVGGTLHVSVLHDDGVRTTYSFLQAVAVRRGDPVQAGQVVGRAASRLHWGARVGDAYVDPLLLLGGTGRGRARLVPESGERRPRSEAEERDVVAGLLRLLGRGSALFPVVRGVRASAQVAALVRDEVARRAGTDRGLAAWLKVLGSLAPDEWSEVAAAVHAVRSSPPCTSPHVAPQAPAGSRRRVAVLVGGFGSSSPDVAGGPSAAVFSLDTAALGYRPEDVRRFSYRGGTVEENRYEPHDTHGGLAGPGTRLRALLDRVRMENPGVPIDLVAHSQGGLVARMALADGEAHGVATLVTLGTPHRGADLASAARALPSTPVRRGLAEQAGDAGLLPAGPSAPALAALAPGSATLAYLDRHLPAPSVRAVSVAARADVVVPPRRSRWDRAQSVTVDVGGVSQHDRLPRSAAAVREVGLAVTGLPPTCRSERDTVIDAMAGVFLGRLEHRLGPALVALGPRVRQAGRP
ncbi:MAG TPA: peptidoglycan DD-metalloendopeptidase family protein, partial [Acidimicrobiales bacterium]